MPICMYRYTRLWFGAISVGDMYLRKIDDIFKELPNVCAISDDILAVGYDKDDTQH